MDTKKELMRAWNMAILKGREFPVFPFVIGVLVYTQLAAFIILAIGSGGFIGYVHGRYLLFALAPFIYALIVNAFAKKMAAPKQWKLSEFVRLLGSAMIPNALMPIVAVAALIHIAFSGFAGLIMFISTASAIIHSSLYLRQRVLLSQIQTALAVGVATVVTLVLLYAIHLILFPNPWEYLLQFVGQEPR